MHTYTLCISIWVMFTHIPSSTTGTHHTPHPHHTHTTARTTHTDLKRVLCIWGRPSSRSRAKSEIYAGCQTLIPFKATGYHVWIGKGSNQTCISSPSPSAHQRLRSQGHRAAPVVTRTASPWLARLPLCEIKDLGAK